MNGWLRLAGARIALLAAAGFPLAAQETPSFRSGVELIVVPASVTRDDLAVVGLTAADFELRDNGVVQKVTTASVESLPVDVTLLLDTSGSLKGAALEQFKADVVAMVRLLDDAD